MSAMPDIDDQLRRLAAVATDPTAFALLWIGCLAEMDACPFIDPNGDEPSLRVFWPVDGHHSARSAVLRPLVDALDAAAARPALLAFLTAKSEIAS